MKSCLRSGCKQINKYVARSPKSLWGFLLSIVACRQPHGFLHIIHVNKPSNSGYFCCEWLNACCCFVFFFTIIIIQINIELSQSNHGPIQWKDSVPYKFDLVGWANFIIIWLWARSEEHTSELQSHVRISYAVFCLKKKKKNKNQQGIIHNNNI